MEAGYGRPGGVTRRLATETKQAFKTTEFWVYVLAVIAVLIAGTVDDSEGSAFGADNVWLFVTLLTIGYMVSRGIAKSGSRDPYWDSPDSGDTSSLGDRVRTAAQVLKEGETGQHTRSEEPGASTRY
jgi:hypothetical protein